MFQAVYNPVTHWIHRDEDVVANFYHIKTENHNTLKLTGKHFIYKTACDKSGKIQLFIVLILKNRNYC